MSAASDEQAHGVEQIDSAITQMSQTTQLFCRWIISLPEYSRTSNRDGILSAETPPGSLISEKPSFYLIFS